jgi:hypothetical protein
MVTFPLTRTTSRVHARDSPLRTHGSHGIRLVHLILRREHWRQLLGTRWVSRGGVKSANPKSEAILQEQTAFDTRL